MAFSPPPTQLDAVAIHTLAPSQTQLFSSRATATAATPGEDWREELDSDRRPSTVGTLESSHGGAATAVHSIHDDDAITRHHICTIGLEEQQQGHQQQQPQQLQDGLSPRPPLTTQMTRPRRRSSTRVSVDYSVPSFRLDKTEANLCVDQSEAVCEIHDHHGTTAIAEEEEALEHSAALTAAKQAALLAQQRMDDIEAATGLGEGGSGESRASNGVNAAETECGSCGIGRARSGSSLCLCLPPPRHHHLLNSGIMANSAGDGATRPSENNSHINHSNCEEDDQHHDEDVEDNFLSGLCLPRSQFFQTSVICSNTMARDALANERTFLSWLNVSIALCLVSFTFISKSFTFDLVREDTGEEKDIVHKDHLSLAVGYVCFAVASFAAIYSALKYLRNIRRISTRYPFAQAGKWTFTLGMIVGTLIMVVLVLAYTTNPQ